MDQIQKGLSYFSGRHRRKIDSIPSQQGKGALRRIDNVLECWIWNGRMHYGELLYAFRNNGFFKEGFPADFVAEGTTLSSVNSSYIILYQILDSCIAVQVACPYFSKIWIQDGMLRNLPGCIVRVVQQHNDMLQCPTELIDNHKLPFFAEVWHTMHNIRCLLTSSLYRACLTAIKNEICS